MANYSVTSWTRSMYDFETPGYNKTTKLASQLIWASTKEVGFGMITDYTPDPVYLWKDIYITVHFYPLGNIAGYFSKNVFPPLGQKVVVKTPEPDASTYNMNLTKDSLSAFRDAALKRTNKYRYSHSAPVIIESAALDASAQAKVELIMSSGVFKKSTIGVGELIYAHINSAGDVSVNTSIGKLRN